MFRDMVEASHVVRALLLGFRDSHLIESIERLEEVMRDGLGWSVCKYWIGIDGNDDAYDRLENVIFNLRSHIRHPSEKISDLLRRACCQKHRRRP